MPDSECTKTTFITNGGTQQKWDTMVRLAKEGMLGWDLKRIPLDSLLDLLKRIAGEVKLDFELLGWTGESWDAVIGYVNSGGDMCPYIRSTQPTPRLALQGLLAAMLDDRENQPKLPG